MSDSSDPPPRHFRAHARRAVNFSATLVAAGGAFQRPARLLDLGLGGARVRVSDAVPPGSPVGLVLSAPHLWDPLQLEGSVVWQRQAADATELGVRFHHRSAATLRALGELFEAMLFG